MKIEDALIADSARANSPFKLDTPQLVLKNLEDYKSFWRPKLRVQ